jgi:hypothetical protein
MTGVASDRTIPLVGELRGHLRKHRVKTRSLTARLGDAYGQLFNLVMIGGITISAADSGLQAAASPDLAIPAHQVDLLRWFVALGTALLLALLCKLALTVGPILARSAWQSWLLSTPVPRRSLLTRRFLAFLVVGGAAGLSVAVLVAVAARPPDITVVLGPSVPAGLLVASLLVRIQTRPVQVRMAQRILSWIAGLCMVGFGVLALIGPAVRWPSVASAPVLVIVATTVSAVSAILASWWAYIGLGRLNRASLVGGTEIADATVTAVNWLDPTLLSATLAVRRARAIGRVRPARLSGDRAGVLLRAEFARHQRSPLGVLLFIALLPLPYLAALTLPGNFVAAIHLICTFLAADRLTTGLRTICRSTALRRAIGGSDRELRSVHLVLPGLGAALWGIATAPALPGLPILPAVISILGSVAVIYRIATRPPMEYTLSAVDTPMGMMPISLISQILRGPALLLVLTAAQLLLW